MREAFPGDRDPAVAGVRPEDDFTNRFAAMARLPFLPVIAAQRKFQPVYVRDLAKAIALAALHPDLYGGKTFEIGGPQVMSMVELHQAILELTGQSPEVVHMPDFVASTLARFGWLPGAPITRDQWLMLQRDNVPAKGAARSRRVRDRSDAARRRRLRMARPLSQGRQVRGPPAQPDRDLLSPLQPMPILLIAIILGIVEGVTEFLPVSSTGHLILATELLGYDADKWAAFNVIIQLGAILAIIVLYWRTFWAVIEGMIRGEGASWRFVRNVLIGFLPSAVLGFILLKHIEPARKRDGRRGGADRRRHRHPGHREAGEAQRHGRRRRNPCGTAVGIGVAQCLAMIPGVSRSGATIMGALSLGVERRTAAEFSFFLAIPTMVGATTLELVKHHDEIMAGAQRRRLRDHRRRLHRQLRRRARRGTRLRPLHLEAWLRALRLVPDRRGMCRDRLAELR